MIMVKNLKIYALIACSLFIGAACGSDTESDTTPAPDKKPEQPQIGETITYRAQVWAEKNDIEELYGGERQFRQNLANLIYNYLTIYK